MARYGALALLAIGIVVAAVFGARNGDTHVRYRTAAGQVEVLEDGPLKQAAEKERDSIGIPPPRQRLAEWGAAGGVGWGVGVLLIGVGAVIARRQQAAEAAGTGGTSEGRVDFPASVQRVLDQLADVGARIADLPMDDDAPEVRESIDAIADELLLPVVEGRGQLMARHGIARFAEYFSPFSAGERYLHRVWSALTDGHAEVARASLQRSRESFQQALTAYEAVESTR